VSKIQLSNPEYMQLARLISRLAKMRSHLSKAEMGKGNNALVKEISNKISPLTAEAETHDIFLKRQHLRFLEDMMLEAIAVLRNKVIPEYEKNGPQDRSKYIEAAKSVADLYASILGKVEDAL